MDRRSLKFTKQLIATSGDPGVVFHAKKLQRRMEMVTAIPMSEILAKLPGRSSASNCRLLQVSRPTYYEWLNGNWRPGPIMAKKIARLTGFSFAEVRGHVGASGRRA